MANTFNQVQETQFSAFGQQRLSEQDKFLIEALLVDRGILAGAVAAPTPTPAPAPSPTPAPAPSQTGSITVNTFLRLAMSPVNPGDLITARFVNDMVAALLELDRRVTELEGGIGKATPTPSPTPASSSASLSGGSRAAGKSQPIIASVEAVTIKGRGVSITVTGDNMGEGLLERVLLGPTAITPSSIKFAGGSFSFLTTTAIVSKAANRLTVVTRNGEDSAPITASRVPQ